MFPNVSRTIIISIAGTRFCTAIDIYDTQNGSSCNQSKAKILLMTLRHTTNNVYFKDKRRRMTAVIFVYSKTISNKFQWQVFAFQGAMTIVITATWIVSHTRFSWVSNDQLPNDQPWISKLAMEILFRLLIDIFIPD